MGSLYYFHKNGDSKRKKKEKSESKCMQILIEGVTTRPEYRNAQELSYFIFWGRRTAMEPCGLMSGIIADVGTEMG